MSDRLIYSGCDHTPHISPTCLECRIEELEAENKRLIATQCTSPWPDSLPCRGIQRQIERAEAAEAHLDAVRFAVFEQNANLRAFVEDVKRLLNTSWSYDSSGYLSKRASDDINAILKAHGLQEKNDG